MILKNDLNDQPGWQEAGFVKDDDNLDAALSRLESHIQNTSGLFAKFSKEQLLHRSAPGKWSRQEILGHLVDSAINNLKRFTEIQFLPQPYHVVSYQQDDLVKVNHYQDLPLEHLLGLWKSLNQQILYVAKNISPEKLGYKVDSNYDNGELKTLGWIIADYVEHMEHHFRQL